ncbi:MAG: glycosyltransferase family 39 protein [Pirellulales bacterium]|nr:glycosyltransferase family 39 protein [Pirellulales bacterium]
MSRDFLGPLLVSLAALAAVAATVAPDGAGPGVTCDEPYHVFHGKRLVAALRTQGLEFFDKANIERNFDWRRGAAPVQAPLGHWILGWTHYLFDPAPDDPRAFSIPAARFAPAAAFAVLIFIVGAWTAGRAGALAGTAAAAATALTPRLFAHAHFAALDMLTALFFAAALLAAADAARSGKTWRFALAGAVWGAAMLVRLHGLLLAPPVCVWLIWRFRRRAARPLAAWSAAGAATLFVGWPWLWTDPIGHFMQYLASGSDRLSLHVFYWGRTWADRDAPWHYPWVMFAVTVPLGFLVLGILGLWSRRRANAANDPFPAGEGALIAGAMLFMLSLFSLPGVPVYDGVRLFLMVFPLWAIWVGVGAGWLASGAVQAERGPAKDAIKDGGAALRLSHPTIITTVVCVFVAAQAVGLAMYHPCQLSYYNLLTGGLYGADRLGFETTYWGDSVREPLLARAVQLSPDEPIMFAPNLASFQVPAVAMCSPSLSQPGVELVGEDRNDPASTGRCRYAVIFNRKADPPSVVGRGKVVREYRKQGVWLSRFVELTAPLDEQSQ